MSAPAERLTDEQAEEMRRALCRHYRQPVWPLHRVCDALEEWSILSGEHLPVGQIRKSNLLFRLLYLGESSRKVKCPVHDGRWSGCTFPPPECGCASGYNVTGWLPNGDPGALQPGCAEPILFGTVKSDGTFEVQEP